MLKICSNWLSNKRSENTLIYNEIEWKDSDEWVLCDGIFTHKTGGFFSVCGVTSRAKTKLADVAIPIINQPEIGILGFIVAPNKNGWRWLLQAKAEPGNKGIVQLAPTVQATYSNYSQKHEGKSTPYLSHFLDQNQSLLADTLQSEQGTKFLRKFNRNSICNADVEAIEKNYQWFNVEDIQEALKTDFSINTDARSVIVTSPWKLITLRHLPFAQIRNKGECWSDMHASYNAAVEHKYISQIQQKIKLLITSLALETETCRLDSLQNWKVDAKGVTSHKCDNQPIDSFRFYRIHATEREVQSWSQPLAIQKENDRVILFCQKRKDILRFLLRPSFEVGLVGGVEIGPSYQKLTISDSSSEINQYVIKGAFKIIISVNQTDEGGRFMLNYTNYQVCQLPENIEIGELDGEDYWVTLAELEVLCMDEKQLTNEARSVISLLLAYA